MSDEQPTLDPFTLERFELTIENRLRAELPQDVSLTPRDVLMPTFEATIRVDADAYERLTGKLPEPLYTVEISIDLNPWRRKARGWRPRLVKVRDCAWWSFRRHVLRRELLEHVGYTVPNCRIARAEDAPPHPTTQGESKP